MEMLSARSGREAAPAPLFGEQQKAAEHQFELQLQDLLAGYQDLLGQQANGGAAQQQQEYDPSENEEHRYYYSATTGQGQGETHEAYPPLEDEAAAAAAAAGFGAAIDDEEQEEDEGTMQQYYAQYKNAVHISGDQPSHDVFGPPPPSLGVKREKPAPLNSEKFGRNLEAQKVDKAKKKRSVGDDARGTKHHRIDPMTDGVEIHSRAKSPRLSKGKGPQPNQTRRLSGSLQSPLLPQRLLHGFTNPGRSPRQLLPRSGLSDALASANRRRQHNISYEAAGPHEVHSLAPRQVLGGHQDAYHPHGGDDYYDQQQQQGIAIRQMQARASGVPKRKVRRSPAEGDWRVPKVQLHTCIWACGKKKTMPSQVNCAACNGTHSRQHDRYLRVSTRVRN